MSNKAVSNIINQVLGNDNILCSYPIDLYQSFISSYSKYNILSKDNQPFIADINNDPLNFSQIINKKTIENHTYPILLFQDFAPAVLKKEDKYILANKLKNAYKIFFSEQIQNNWSINDDLSFVINHGVKTVTNIKTKNVIVLNFNQNKLIDQIYAKISQAISNVDIISSMNDFEETIKLISQYKVAVCIGSSYNALSCAGCGCLVLSNSTNTTPDIESIINIDKIDSIDHQINNMIKNYTNYSDLISRVENKLKNNYFFLDHISELDKVFAKIQSKGYIYES